MSGTVMVKSSLLLYWRTNRMKAMVLPLNEALILFATDYYDVINMFDIHFMKFDKYVVIW